MGIDSDDYNYHRTLASRSAYAANPDTIREAGKTLADRGYSHEVDPKETQRVLKMLGLIHFVNVRHPKSQYKCQTEVSSRFPDTPYELADGSEW